MRREFIFIGAFVALSLPVSSISSTQAIAQTITQTMTQGFDCSKASIAIEKLICSDTNLKESDDKMARAYNALKKKLSPIGRKKLLTAQRNWLQVRNEMIVESTIAQTYNEHIEFLKKTPAGMVPFYRNKEAKPFKLGGSKIGYLFADPKATFQKTFNKQIFKVLSEYQIGEKTEDSQGFYEVTSDFTTITRFDQHLIAAQFWTEGATGGAHPFHSSVYININVQTGKPIKISALFSKQTRKKLALACAVQLAQDRTAYEKDTALATFNAYQEAYPNQITNHIKDASRWQFEKTETTISFNEYAIAPYVAGEQRCSFENAFLAPLSKRPTFFK